MRDCIFFNSFINAYYLLLKEAQTVSEASLALTPEMLIWSAKHLLLVL